MDSRDEVRRRLALAQVPRHNGLNEVWRMEERARMTRKDQKVNLRLWLPKKVEGRFSGNVAFL